MVQPHDGLLLVLFVVVAVTARVLVGIVDGSLMATLSVILARVGAREHRWRLDTRGRRSGGLAALHELLVARALAGEWRLLVAVCLVRLLLVARQLARPLAERRLWLEVALVVVVGVGQSSRGRLSLEVLVVVEGGVEVGAKLVRLIVVVVARRVGRARQLGVHAAGELGRTGLAARRAGSHRAGARARHGAWARAGARTRARAADRGHRGRRGGRQHGRGGGGRGAGLASARDHSLALVRVVGDDVLYLAHALAVTTHLLVCDRTNQSVGGTLVSGKWTRYWLVLIHYGAAFALLWSSRQPLVS